MEAPDTRNVYNLKMSLGNLGFTKAATETQGGRVVSETYFTPDGLQVTIGYTHMNERHK